MRTLRNATPSMPAEEQIPSVSTVEDDDDDELCHHSPFNVGKHSSHRWHGSECHRRRRSQAATQQKEEAATARKGVEIRRKSDKVDGDSPRINGYQTQQTLLSATAAAAFSLSCLLRRRRSPPKAMDCSNFSAITSSSSFSMLLTVIVIILQQQRTANVEAVRCYCTDEHCVPYGVCEAAVCLVGLLRANNAVIRTCGNEALGCQRNLDRWSHICSCEEHFCNTFLFLRASTNIDSGGTAPGGGRNGPLHEQQQAHDDRIFERMDRPSGEFATFDHPGEGEERPIKNSNLLTMLLVIVPLSVGAAAVVVVAFNYYCHLC